MVQSVEHVDLICNGLELLLVVNVSITIYMHCTFLSLIVLYCPSVIMCDELARPSNGNITFSMGVMPSFGVMTVATYNCHTGYALTGGKNVRVCVGISDAQLGQWNGSEPVCKSKYTLYRKNDLTV